LIKSNVYRESYIVCSELENTFLYGEKHNYIHLEITAPKTNEKIVSETIDVILYLAKYYRLP